MEVWKDIKGYEGLYQVSNLGRVKSLHFNIAKQNSENIMKPQESWGGYSRVILSKNGKTKLYAIHRLVAMAFIENPKNKPLVDHIDGDRRNNKVENLRWCTHSENSQNSIFLKSTDRYNSVKVKDNQGHEFNSYREAGRFWGISANTVKNDCLGKTVYSELQQGTNFERNVRFSFIGGTKDVKRNF